MENIARKYTLTLIAFTVISFSLQSQNTKLTDYVNPFIGTGRSEAPTFWGAEGGTYPGAAAPFGAIHISPETNITSEKGYNYRDSLIFFFSCAGHMSGYPNGASGFLRIMPADLYIDGPAEKYSRHFSHNDEKATPGYYSVRFHDNNTFVETVASERVGIIRVVFPAGVKPSIFLGDIGKSSVVGKNRIYGTKQNSVILFSRDIEHLKKLKVADDTPETSIISFRAENGKETELLIDVAVSGVGHASAEKDIESEIGGLSLTEVGEQTKKKWEKILSVIVIDDPSVENKVKFYTALYHSMLLPWIISDSEGNYAGADHKVHVTTGKNEYGGFSPWDTFRSLHPLMCLLQPDRQNDMIRSMLDRFTQSGRLPGGPMTGNHAIAIITDSWIKNIRDYDSNLALTAIRKTLDSAGKKPDMAEFRKAGFVPGTFTESVTRTVEYSYDDWAVTRFEKAIGHEPEPVYLKGSTAYRNLWDSISRFMLPKADSNFITNPGFFGYKEGDKWSYSLFVPHYPADLIDLSGDTVAFTEKLDYALSHRKIFFDNEPVMHIPYLFNFAGQPQKTQLWTRYFMHTHFLNSPGGLPGNDDLGSMSSWFVFSALGIFPFAPGNPEYTLGSPLFRQAVIHLPENKTLTIRAENTSEENIFVGQASVGGKVLSSPFITHQELLNCGELVFSMRNAPSSDGQSDTADPFSGLMKISPDTIMPQSGDRNNSCILDLKYPAAVNSSPFLDIMGDSITVMTWIWAGRKNEGLRDLITKGDFIALQLSGNKRISFFAGGWGRGSCEAQVPSRWTGRWHHLAGVSDGKYLRLFIDGREADCFNAETPVNLSYTGKWMIGRNEEFPGQRIFSGEFRNIRIFRKALTPNEIQIEMHKR
jgi:putative alpha-1,2-mannosidase